MTYYRPPSIDREPEQVTLKECPFCEGNHFGFAKQVPGNFQNVYCQTCRMHGPPEPKQLSAIREWNSIPRRSEVRELLWFIDMVGQHVIAAEPGSYTLAGDINRMCDYADKLRKEWNL